MLLRAILSREFLISAAVIAASASMFGYQAIQQQERQSQLLSPQTEVSLLNDDLQTDTPQHQDIVAVVDFDFVGDPFQKDDAWYQLLSDKQDPGTEIDFDKATLVLAHSFNLEADELRQSISNSQGSYWRVSKVSDKAEENLSHPEYPNVELASLHQIRCVDTELAAWAPRLMWLIFGGMLLVIPWALYLQIKFLKKRDFWTAKLENFDPEISIQHPHAMRLCGTDSGSLSTRRIDSEFDVPHKPPVKKPKLKRWSWKIGAALGVATVGVGLQMGTSYGIEQFLNIWWVKTAAMLVLMIGVNVAIAMVSAIKVAGLQEEEVKPGSRWACYQKLPFFKYHDHVLKSLGMIELGAFRQNGCQNPLVRTIYLSPHGNLLVEVGCEMGKEFFTIESVINSGKFLETHSLAKPSQSKSDLMLRHQRRSANHEDIFQALDEHDHFVAEFASGFQEAQFDDEKMPRFLEWGGEKNAV